MSTTKPTPTVEDYLGIIYTLERDGEPVIGARLAEWLEVSAPTVTVTLKRMIRDGWITMNERKEISLSPTGRDAARMVIRQHMLTELLLAQVLGVPWSMVHEEAHRVEHGWSSKTVERMAAVLDNPASCPHGNPLPNHESSATFLVPLVDACAGREWVVARIHERAEQNPELMTFLEKQGVVPGARVWVESVAALNETVSLRVDDTPVVLGLAVAKHISVRES